MEFVINNKNKVSSKTALRIREISDGNRIKNGIIALSVVAIIDILLLFLNLTMGLLLLGILVIECIYVVLFSINKGRKLIAVIDGLVISANDSVLKIGKETFSYMDINHIVIDNDFIVIKIGEIGIPILITDESRENVTALVELMKTKNIYSR